MRKQQQIWHNEHASQGTLPTMANAEPASGVVLFTDYLKEHDVALSGKAIDIGAGKGRNSVHLAKLGFEVWALEYIEPALPPLNSWPKQMAWPVTYTLNWPK